MAKVPQFETPNKALSYVAFILGICGVIVALITILASTPLLNPYIIQGVVWIIGFVILIATIILCLISTSKKIGSGLITYRAEILAIATAILLVIASVLGIIFK